MSINREPFQKSNDLLSCADGDAGVVKYVCVIPDK